MTEYLNSWIYSLFLMLDATFRMKLRSKVAKNDVALGDGQSFFVSDGPYKEHLKDVIDEKEVRTYRV